MSSPYFRNSKTGELALRKSFKFNVNKDMMAFAVAHSLNTTGQMSKLSALTHSEYKEITLNFIEANGYNALLDREYTKVSDDYVEAQSAIKKAEIAFDGAFKGLLQELTLSTTYFATANELKDILIVEKLGYCNTERDLKKEKYSNRELINLYQDHINRHGIYGLDRLDTDYALYGKDSTMINAVYNRAEVIVKRAVPKLHEKSEA